VRIRIEANATMVGEVVKLIDYSAFKTTMMK